MNDVRNISDEVESLEMVLKRAIDPDMPFSPLSVCTKNMLSINLPPLRFHDFDEKPCKMKLTNNGRTVSLIGSWADRRPYITGSCLADKYYFSHLHFHWADRDDAGSEHIINSQCYSMEMHLIFYKGSCQSLVDAKVLHDGSVTLAYLFEINRAAHEGFQMVTPYLDSVRAYRQTGSIPSFPLSQLANKSSSEYFIYWGKSKKIGGMTGVSQWIVFTEASGVSVEQVECFRHILSKLDQRIRHNCRTATEVTGTKMAYLVPALVNQVIDNASMHLDILYTSSVNSNEEEMMHTRSLCSICPPHSPSITTSANTISFDNRQQRSPVKVLRDQGSRVMAKTTERKIYNIRPALTWKATRTQLLRRKFIQSIMESQIDEKDRKTTPLEVIHTVFVKRKTSKCKTTTTKPSSSFIKPIWR